MNRGVLHDIHAKIDANASSIHEIRAHVQSIESRMLTTEQTKKVNRYLNMIEGWQGILISIGAVTAFAYTAIQLIGKLQ
jgi:prefoldin subunit 5